MKNEKTGRMAKHYECSHCKKLFPQKEIEINHIVPVVPITGFDDWGSVIERMFCEIEGLEALCKTCHSDCTAQENVLRKNNNGTKQQ